MKLYNYFRSGTSHRLRIALNLKGLAYDYVPVHLLKDEQRSPDYLALNPQGLVPALVLEPGELGSTTALTLTQTPAILEWLEEACPTPPLLPHGCEARARVRALAAIVGCDIHPLNNRRVLETLRSTHGADKAAIDAWAGTWIGAGFDAIEALLAADTARDAAFCFGDAPTLADVYLVPQVESSRRFSVDLTRWPRIARVDAACSRLEPFRRAHPTVQPDAVS